MEQNRYANWKERIKGICAIAGMCMFCLLVSTPAYACDSPECPGLPKEKTDCIECLYGSWDNGLKEYTMRLCEENDIPYPIVTAIIWNESRYKANAIGYNSNGTNDWGLMQLNDSTFPFLSDTIGIESMRELLDPKTNILAGVTLLRYHKSYTHNNTDMLIRYQMGEGAFSRFKKKGGTVTKSALRVLEKGETIEEVIKDEGQKPKLRLILA